jgi:diguanylate cyclase (GGDEF)-like protein/PAS domain S-box-containing protein
MTLQKQIEHALRESEERYRSVIDILSEGVMLQAADGRIVACNRSAERILGVPVDEMIDRVLDPSEWYTFYEDGSPFPPAAFPAQVTLRTGVPQKNVMMGIHRQDGPLAWILINTQPLVQAGVHTPYAVVVSFTDISERKQREERLRHLAFHDTLTNLPNRAMFMNRLRQALQHTRDYPDELFAVILFDLDHFKVINDSLGHPVGDLLLSTTAQRLEFCMREGDIIARLGGDEFAVLIEDILSPNDAIEVAERIQQTLNEPMELDGYTIFTSASIGIVVNYSDVSAYRYEHPEDVLRDADTAMYRAKERGRAGYAMFDGEMRSQAIERLAIGTGLRQALARNELRLLYQPIVDLTSGEVVSLEALLHWNHPQRGLLSSEAFIGVANESGLIVSLGQWVLRETCRQIRAWMNEDALRMRQANQAPIAVNINISSHEFLYPSFVDEIRHALEAHSLDAHFLRLEIAESIVMYPTESLMPTLNQLHDLGVQLCLDGFGKGYLSLQHIAHFLIPMLKMDRSLVHTMHKDEKSLPIIQAIVMLAHTLEMDVVAVEVETEQQLARLKEMGCNFGQGFLFSRPVSAHTAAMLLRSEALHMISRAS